MSRPSAQDAYRRFRNELSGHPFCPVKLDFNGVKVLAPSWLDEFMQLLRKDDHDIYYETPKRNASVIQSLKTIEESAATTTEKHPWRICSLGFHWVIEHPRQKRAGKIEDVDGHCRRNPSHKDTIYTDELDKIADTYFSKLRSTLYPAPSQHKNGARYDPFIEGWTLYWNEVLKPTVALDSNLIKALIFTESSFEENPPKKKLRATGLMQLLPQTVKILGDPKGELPDHIVSISMKDAERANPNIACGIRWLFWKKRLASIKLKREASWEEAVWEYKSVTSNSKRDREIRNTFNEVYSAYKK